MEQTGGIFGYIGLETSTTHNLNIQYAVNAGEVSGSQNVGGCVGRLYDDMNDVEHKISYCANYGKVSNSGNGNLGGILGQGDSKKMIIMNSANHGERSPEDQMAHHKWVVSPEEWEKIREASQSETTWSWLIAVTGAISLLIT